MIEMTAGHTVKRFDGELGHLHTLGLEMGGLVVDQMRRAIKALHDPRYMDPDTAWHAILVWS